MAKPVAVIAAFERDALPKILAAVKAGPQPPIADWYVGTYGINPADAKKIRAKGCRYAPVFAIKKGFRDARKLPAEDAAKLDPTFAGRIPGGEIPSEQPRAWGIELGRRYRDAIRKRRRARVPVQIDAWQFDEILGECATSPTHRAFVGGILKGLARGRAKLGDKHEQGLVWSAFTALTGLPSPGVSAEVARFWRDLDDAALFLVGEEYPSFHKPFASEANDFSRGHVRLAGLHPQLASRYVVGMTPGWLISAGLRGNPPPRKTLAAVADWRKGYIAKRNGLRLPKGYGQFNFASDNTQPGPLKAAVAMLHVASGELV
jgi:hypothetical protein